MGKINKNKIRIKKTILSAIAALIASVVVLFIVSAVFRMNRPPVNSEVDPSVEKITKWETIQLRIVNACGVNGLAAKCRNYLRARGFDVVETKNWDTVIPVSRVIDKLGDRASASKVAFAMGIGDSLIAMKKDSSAFIRCEIVLGLDYPALKPFK